MLAEHQPAIAACKNFDDDLFPLIDRLARDVRGIGTLAVYDTAHRLGLFLGLEPTRVHLHAGTRAGAMKLGLDVSRGWLSMGDLPIELRHLTPAEVEDVLCIYKDRFRPPSPVKHPGV